MNFYNKAPMRKLLLALPLFLGLPLVRPSNPIPGVITVLTRTTDSLIVQGLTSSCGTLNGSYTGVSCRIQWLVGPLVVKNDTVPSAAPTADTLRWHSLAAGTKVRFRLRACAGSSCSSTKTTTFIVPTSGTGTPVVATLTSLAIHPKPTSLVVTDTVRFTASASWSDGTTTLPALTWTSTGGSISGTGLYTAHDTVGTYRAIVGALGKADTSVVSVLAATAPQPVTSGVTLPDTLHVRLVTTRVAPSGTVHHVPTGGALQDTLTAASCGDRILLAAHGSYTGPITLKRKGCTSYALGIEITTDTTLPAEGTRASLAGTTGYATILSPGGNLPALTADTNAAFYRITGVRLQALAGVGLNAIVKFDPNITDTLQLAHDLILDRVVVIGSDSLNLQRCVTLNARRAAVIDSYLAKCHYKGQEGSAIGLWNTTGPIKIVNNYLEGSAQNIIVGGARPQITNMIPTDIEIRRNWMNKPIAWFSSGAWTVKTSMELKMGRRVLIDGNVIQNCWADAQTGFPFNIKASSDASDTPWLTTSDVMISNNVAVNTAKGMDISAYAGPNPVTPMVRIAIVNNLLYKLGTYSTYAIQDAAGFQIDPPPTNITVQNNTVVGASQYRGVIFSGSKQGTLSLKNNLIDSWIQSGDGLGWGTYALNGHVTTWTAVGNGLVIPFSNVIADHPAGNFYVGLVSQVGYTDITGGNFLLTAASPFKGRGTDGRDPGADITALLAAISGVVP